MSLYRNYPQNIRSIRMYSVLYPESNFWWVFRNGSGMVPETFHNTFLGCSSKFFLIYCCQLSFVSGCHFLGKILISCYFSIIFLLKENQFGVFTVSNITTKGINNTGYYHQYSKIIITLVFLYFHFSYLYLLLGGKHNCLHAKSRYK